MMPIVRNKFETMKLENTPPTDALNPIARAATQIVKASSRKIIACMTKARKSTR